MALSDDRFQTAALRVADRAAALVQPGMRLGLGSGRMAQALLEALHPRVAAGLELAGLCTSRETEERARAAGIRVLEDDGLPLDLDLDGADEYDPRLNLLKGGGGALLREKVVAQRCLRMWALVDATKAVSTLGSRRPLALEVLPFGWRGTASACSSRLRVEPTLRGGEQRPFVTDNGNYVLDLEFPVGLQDPESVSRELAGIAGVLGHGLFLGIATAALVADEKGVEVLGDLEACRLL